MFLIQTLLRSLVKPKRTVEYGEFTYKLVIHHSERAEKFEEIYIILG